MHPFFLFANYFLQIRYEDGDDEWTSLYGQKIKFHLSKDEMRQKNLKCWDPERGLDSDDIIMLAASFCDNEELEHGDVIWAEIMGKSILLPFGCSHLLACIFNGNVS